MHLLYLHICAKFVFYILPVNVFVKVNTVIDINMVTGVNISLQIDYHTAHVPIMFIIFEQPPMSHYHSTKI